MHYLTSLPLNAVFLAGGHFDKTLPTFPGNVIYVTSLTSQSPNLTETQKDGLA